MKQIKKDIYNLLIQVIILGALVAVGCGTKFSIVMIVSISIMSFVDIVCLWILMDRINRQAKIDAINEEMLAILWKANRDWKEKIKAVS